MFLFCTNWIYLPWISILWWVCKIKYWIIMFSINNSLNSFYGLNCQVVALNTNIILYTTWMFQNNVFFSVICDAGLLDFRANGFNLVRFLIYFVSVFDNEPDKKILEIKILWNEITFKLWQMCCGLL